MTEQDELRLEAFLPYRLSVLSNTVSAAIAAAYAERFDLSIPEWRAMAVIARFPGISANEVAERTAMDKVAVSRAVNRLIENDRLARCFAPTDRRRSKLALTRDGHRIYRKVVPLALAYERALLEGLDRTEKAQLDRLLAKLKERSAALGDAAIDDYELSREEAG